MTNTLPAKLTPKQEAFCRAMLTEPDQSSAYRRAYNVKKSSSKSVNEMASKAMADPKIASRVAELRQAAVDASIMDRTEWLQWCTKVSRYDAGKMYDAFGNPKEIHELEENERAAIEGFEFVENFIGKKKEEGGDGAVAVGITKKFKIAQRATYLKILGQAQGYLKEDARPMQIGHLTMNQTNITIAPDESYHRMIQGG